MRIVCISDTHNLHEQLVVPDGDLLIHAGDLTHDGNLRHLKKAGEWIASLPHKHKIVIPGNHDLTFESKQKYARMQFPKSIHILINQGIELDGVKFYGSPVTPRFFDWAFNVNRGRAIRMYWQLIPTDTDVLITHGPPLGYGDKNTAGDRCGCEDLLEAIIRINPKVHVCGHIHEGYGYHQINEDGCDTFVLNASSCNRFYACVNPPLVHDL